MRKVLCAIALARSTPGSLGEAYGAFSAVFCGPFSGRSGSSQSHVKRAARTIARFQSSRRLRSSKWGPRRTETVPQVRMLQFGGGGGI